MVAYEAKSKKIIAVGNKAKKMLGKTPEDIEVTRPIRNGVISDYIMTERMLKIYVKNKKAYWENYLGCILDGSRQSFCFRMDGEGVLEIPVSTVKDGVHELLLFKRQDSCHEITFLGFEIEDNGEVLESPQKSNRRIEVYGDSVSAGEVSEAVEYTGKPDPEHNGQYSNSWYSYDVDDCAQLDAEIQDIAQGGIDTFGRYGLVSRTRLCRYGKCMGQNTLQSGIWKTDRLEF